MSKKLSPLKAIRKYCLECGGGSPKEVKLCVIPHCPLFSFRFGHNPARKGIGATPTKMIQKTAVESLDFHEKGVPNA